MTDLHDRFRSLDRISAPDLWWEATQRSTAPQAGALGNRESLRNRTSVVVPVAFVTVVLVAAFVGFGLFNGSGIGNITGEPRPFQGTWLSTSDADGGTQTMTIRALEDDAIEIVVSDDIASVCSGAPSTMTGTGRLEGSTQLVIPSPVYACDDGSEPQALSGPPLEEQLRNLTFVHDSGADTLTDNFGSIWGRPGETVPNPGPNTSGPPLTAAQEATVGRLVDAVNAAAAGDSGDEASLLDAFTEDAVISPVEGWDESPVTEPGLLEAWILHLRTWGFEGVLQDCLTDVSDRFCVVRARWHTVLAEADEFWHVDFVGDRIQMLAISDAGGARHGDPVLPLSVAELYGWEKWLQATDPETAATLIPNVGSTAPVVLRYDSALADEITASIQLYLTQRPAGDEIRVTADLVEFGDRLVGLSGNMDRADGRTYVIAGRYETEMDLLFTPEEAVLAAFDDVGTELWRIDLDETPRDVVAVAGDVWVSHGNGEVSRIDASDGRFIDRVTVGDAWSMFAAFGSVWVRTLDVESGSGQLIRVHPDMTTTTIELPASIIANLDDVPSLNPAAGAGGIWVPLGGAGVAVVDVESGQVTVIPVDDIGHEVREVAVDGDVAYVASSSRVTSFVDGDVVATVSLGVIRYLGRVEGFLGALLSTGEFQILGANDPMVVEVRHVAEMGGAAEIDGDAWVETGRNYDLRRVEFLPLSEGDGG